MEDRNRAGDMLVRLYDLDFFDAAERERELLQEGIAIVRPLPHQFDRVVRFVSRFRPQWGDEVRAALYNSPATLFAATQKGQGIVGFAAYDATAAKLVDLFNENFKQFADHVDEGVRAAAPKGTVAA